MPVIAHQVDISFDIDSHTVQITDQLTVPAGLERTASGRGIRGRRSCRTRRRSCA